MKNLLSVEDGKRFLKKQKMPILLTTLIVFVLYSGLSLYNYFSTTMIQEEVEEYAQELSQEEIVSILENEPEDIRVDQLQSIQESLDVNAVEFRLFIEHEDQTPFGDGSLLKDFLILEDVLNYVENEAGVELPIDPDLAIVIQRRESHPVLSLKVRTGDIEDNMAIAEAYEQAFEEGGIIPFTSDKQVYLLDESPGIYTRPLIDQILEALTLFSPLSIGLGMIASIFVGLIIGILIGLAKNMSSKTISELSILENDVHDNLVPLYRIKDKEEQIDEKMIQTILYPKNGLKLVLSQTDLNQEVLNALKTENIIIADDVSHAPNDRDYKEVIIIVSLESTTKAWYDSQRILLEKFDAAITIIQV